MYQLLPRDVNQNQQHFFPDQDDRLDNVETTVMDQTDPISNLQGRVDVLEETDVTIQSDITGWPQLIQTRLIRMHG